MKKTVVKFALLLGTLTALLGETTTVSLSAGWNAIGTNSHATLSEIQSSLGSNLLNIQSPDGSKTYNSTSTRTPTFDAFETGIGYWIKVSNAADLTTTNVHFTETTTISLSTGWNLIDPITDLNLTQIQTQLGSSLLNIQNPDGSKTYNSTSTRTPTFQNFYAGDAFWIKTSSNIDLEFEAETTVQPAPSTPTILTPPEQPSIDTSYYDGLLHYDGQTASRVSITLPTGTYNVYAEDTGTNDNYIYNIDTSITYQDGDINRSVAVVSSNSGLQFSNDTGSDQNYTINFDVEYENSPISADMWVAIVSEDANYSTRGEFTFGDVTTNSGAILNLNETHAWATDVLSSADAGSYTLTVSTDTNSSLNPLKNFFVSIVQNGNNEYVFGENLSQGSDNGYLTSRNIALESGASYNINISTEHLQTVRDDYFGYYTIKLIKQ